MLVMTNDPTSHAPTHHTPKLYRRLVVATLFSGMVLAGAACSDDDDDNEGTDTTEGATDNGGDDDNGDDGNVNPGFTAAACDAWVELGSAFAAAPEDPAEMAAFGETLVGIVESFEGAVPEALDPNVTTLLEGAQAVATDGNPEGLFSEEGMQAQTNIGAFAHDDCDGTKVDVEATEYAFDGIDDELPAGRTSFKFVNNGSEEHELIVLRRNDESDATFEDLAAGGPDAMFAEAAFTGVVFAPPSATSYAALDLEPGTYFMVCTIPVGGEEGGDPHLAHGMHQTVEVG